MNFALIIVWLQARLLQCYRKRPSHTHPTTNTVCVVPVTTIMPSTLSLPRSRRHTFSFGPCSGEPQ